MTADNLRDLPVLASLADDELAQLAAAGRERRLATGEFLFHQGDRASAFHLVLDGRLETTREIAGEQAREMGAIAKRLGLEYAAHTSADHGHAPARRHGRPRDNRR